MKALVFTGSCPRHLDLLNRLSTCMDRVYAVVEVAENARTHTGARDRGDPALTRYFACMEEAEKAVFGNIGFPLPNVTVLPIPFGALDTIPLAEIKGIVDECNIVIVFGSSWIRGDLFDAIAPKDPVNIHMGVSPYYKGSSCNFWAIYDMHPQLVGATIHRLAPEIDAGGVLYHVFPVGGGDSFAFGMRAVLAAQLCLCEKVASREIFRVEPLAQDQSKNIRTTRRDEFTGDVALQFMARCAEPVIVPGHDGYGLVRPQFMHC